MASVTPEPSDDDLTGRRRSTYTPPAGGASDDSAGAASAAYAAQQAAQQQAQAGWGDAERAQYAQWEQQMFAIGTPEALAEVQRVRAAYAPYLGGSAAAPQQAAQPSAQQYQAPVQPQHQPGGSYPAAQQPPAAQQQYYSEQANPLPQYNQAPQQPGQAPGYPAPTGYQQQADFSQQPGYAPQQPAQWQAEPQWQGGPQQPQAPQQPRLSPETAARLSQAEAPAPVNPPQDEFVQPVSGYPNWSGQPQAQPAAPQQPLPPRRPEPPQMPGTPASHPQGTAGASPMQAPPGQPSWATGSRQQSEVPAEQQRRGPQHSSAPAPYFSSASEASLSSAPLPPASAEPNSPAFDSGQVEPGWSSGQQPSEPSYESGVVPPLPQAEGTAFAPPIFTPPPTSNGPSYGAASYPPPLAEPISQSQTSAPEPSVQAAAAPEQAAHEASAPEAPSQAVPPVLPRLADPETAAIAQASPSYTPGLAAEFDSTLESLRGFPEDQVAERDQPLPATPDSDLAAPMLSVDEIPSFYSSPQELSSEEPPGLVEPPVFGDSGDYRDSLNLIDSGAIYVQQPADEGAAAPADSEALPAAEAAAPASPPSLAPASFEDVLSGTAPVAEPAAAADFWSASSPQSAPSALEDPAASDAVSSAVAGGQDAAFASAALPAAAAPLGAAADPSLDPLSGMLATAEAQEPVEETTPGAGTVEHAGVEPTPLEQRIGAASRMFWIWFALNSSLLSLTVGAALLASGLNLRQALIATLSGVALSALPLALGTIAGKWSGQPTMVVSRATFGLIGNALPALVAVISRLFWAAVLLWLLAASIAQVLVLAGLDTVLDGSLLTLIAVGAAALIAAIVAGVGYHLLLRLHVFVSALSLVLVIGFIAITWSYVDPVSALAQPDGDWWLVVGGAVLVFAVVGLAFANSTSDVARYQRPSSSGSGAAVWATIGGVLPALVLIGYGAVLAASNEQIAFGFTVDPVRTLAALLPVWYPVPLLLGIGLSVLAGLVTAVYSAGLAVQALGVRGSRQMPVILAVVLAAAAVLGVHLLEIDFAPMLLEHAILVAIPVAAWAGIFIGDLMIRTRRFDSRGLLRAGGAYPNWRWFNLIVFLVLVALGYGLSSAGLPWLQWQGYLVPFLEPLGLLATHPLITGNAVILAVLLLGWLLAVTTGIPAVKKQERNRRMVVDADEEL